MTGKDGLPRLRTPSPLRVRVVLPLVAAALVFAACQKSPIEFATTPTVDPGFIATVQSLTPQLRVGEDQKVFVLTEPGVACRAFNSYQFPGQVPDKTVRHEANTDTGVAEIPWQILVGTRLQTVTVTVICRRSNGTTSVPTSATFEVVQ